MSKKISPRQKMIAMMYLVLTAMLAMNVSKEVLNAFIVVNDGIENSNKIVNSKNIKFYQDFINLVSEEDSTKIFKINSLVLETQILTSESIKYIDFLKEEIKLSSGTILTENGKVLFANLDDLETGTRILTESSGNSSSKGEFLRLELIKIRNNYLEIVDKGNPTEKNTSFYTDYRVIFERNLALPIFPKNVLSQDGETISWVNRNFYNVPVVASDVILSKIQNDIYNSETEVLEFLYAQIGADLPEFDVLKAAVVSPKSYLPAGKIFTADIFVAASSSKQESDVFVGKLDKTKFNKDANGKIIKTSLVGDDLFFIGDYDKIPILNGKAVFEKITSGVGNRSYEGIIRVLKPTGGYDLYPFEFDYEVAPNSSFSVSPTAMNVLYIGLSNPLSITVSDSKESDISVNISQGKVSRVKGKWIAEVTEHGNAMLDVYGIIDGVRKKIGTEDFRVKRVPDPISTLDGKRYDGSITRAKLKAHRGIVPYLGGFAFDVKFTIKSYDFVYKSKTSDVKRVNGVHGPAFTAKIKSIIQQTEKGDMVYFQNIKFIGPDKRIRSLNPIILNVN